MQGLQFLKKIAIKDSGRLDGKDDDFIPPELVPESIVCEQRRIVFVEKTLHGCIDCDSRNLGYNGGNQDEHDNDRFDAVAVNDMGKLFKALFYPVSDRCHAWILSIKGKRV